ncbi:homeobox protein 5 isoform X2 [Euwallacea similis]|uniref:homeobox protein 5 isoform X2 n=1 Tax=Euwallacea similis TaxID=1736056 RepID=UPI00344FD232
MSVLNQSGEEQVECPLCMEPLEVDDLNFFPCTCGYQICRFCWHRIRQDENGGLCPACRKAYSENPADFIPLSREQVAKLKAEKKQRNQQRKALLSESRKHLASVRVVQRNLVFVVGLPPRLADPEILKRHEYFGKFGKIHKVVINQSTSYAGSQGPSASAYVTYLKSDDALRAIQAVNNVTIDNRVIKSSLGTTKYCSHFMKNQSCPKPDCMYLHEYDPEASFTREQMHLGKHQEYEKKLHEDLLARARAQIGQGAELKGAQTQGVKGVKDGTAGSNHNSNNNTSKDTNGGTNKENWPQLDKEKKQEKEKGRKGKTKNSGESRFKEKKDGKGSSSGSESRSSQDSRTTSTSSSSSQQLSSKLDGKDSDSYPSPQLSSEPSPSSSPPSTISPPLQRSTTPSDSSTTPNVLSSPPNSSHSINGMGTFTGKLPPNLVGRSEDNNSYFSSSGFTKIQNNLDNGKTKDVNCDRQRLSGEIESVRPLVETLQDEDGHQMLTDALPNINTTEDWAAAFGFAGPLAREQELLQQKLHQRDVSKLSNFTGGFLPMEAHESAFGKGVDNFSGFYEMSKLQENLMDALANKTNGYNVRPQDSTTSQPQTHISNGLEQNMSKFFSDFHKYNNKEQPSVSPYQNGFNGLHNPYQHILQQKQLEEQFRNLGIKQSFSGAQTTVYQNGIPTPTYTNGDVTHLNGGIHNMFSKSQTPQAANNTRNSEAELDFDPFQETQKALAEMMATEQNHKQYNPVLNTGRLGQMNGVVHNQNCTHILPPPPPGFLQQQQQQQTHMNSFGSKILPFLNMSNSQQQINSPTNNWPSSLNSQVQQQKNIASTCNDWKVLDPAILSSSRSYQVPQMAPAVRDPFTSVPPLNSQQINQNGPVRPFDFPPANNPFSTFTQQLQQQPNFNFTHLNQPQNVNNLNWFTANDINSQISSPPGFRNSQTSKQQEC